MDDHRGERRLGRDHEQRLTLAEAAQVLGTSKDAVRMRVKRRTLRSEKGDDGRVYVWVNVNPDADPNTVHLEPHVDALLEEKDRRIEGLLEQVHHLREILEREGDARRRADTIIAQLSQANAALAARVPELEAPASPPSSPQEPPGGPPNAGAGLSREEPRPATRGPQEGADRPWWRRIFGG